VSLLTQTLHEIQPLDSEAIEATRKALARAGASIEAIGQLGVLVLQLAGIQRRPRPLGEQKRVLLCAADHGLASPRPTARTVSPTMERVLEILARAALVNRMAEQAGAQVHVVDVGIAAEMDPHPDLTEEKTGRGTDDATIGPAMSLMQAVMAIETGIRACEVILNQGTRLVGVAGMGAGSVTSATAVIAAISRRPVVEMIPEARSGGEQQHARAVTAATRAVAANRPDADDMLDVLSKVGGFEIGAIAGVILEAAVRRVPVVLDGLVSAAGALLAGGLSPLAAGYMIAAHESAGAGHRVALQMLRLRPCLAISLPVDGGVGAALALPIVEAGAEILRWMGARDR
jgi:nicotinate-nucleotide--dimethylbenzimidazole phosphoribosyltransferase